MKGVIASFRRGKKRQRCNQFVIYIDGVKEKKDVEKFIGKNVVWKNSKGKKKIEIKGKISNLHGNKGGVRAIFEKGLPGQALGTNVEVE